MSFSGFSHKWIKIANEFLMKYDFTFENCCSIFYLYTKKQPQNDLIDRNVYLQIFRKSLDSYENSNWSAILVNSLFKEFFMKTFFHDEEYFKNDFKITQRITILQILKDNVNLIRIDEFEGLTKFYEKLSTDFLVYLFRHEKNFEDLNYLNDLFLEIKMTLVCINDASSENENEESFRQQIKKRELILRNTCEILNRVHSNEIIKANFNKKDIDEESILIDGYVNLKLELIRFIGILVFENEYNRNVVHETEALRTIIENVNIDINNPFIREWSIVTLRHLYFSKSPLN